MGLKGTAKIFPHLWYTKEAEEAARFYTSIFPDSRVDRVTPLLSESPSGPPGSVTIVDFTLFGQRFQAISAGPHHEFNDAISMVVMCDDQAELDHYWHALLAGGGKEQACGWLIDRFGLRWQIVPAVLDQMMHDEDPARTKRVSDAFLKMVKLDIAALEKAYRGISTRISRHVNAPRTKVYRALLDAQAVATWMVPNGMTSRVHLFDPREGGMFRISLTYDEPTGTGKTTAHTDTYHGRFVKLVPDQQVIQVMEFETADPAMRGQMRATFTLTDAGEGTNVHAVHENLPPGLSPADNEIGWRIALDKLAALVEGDQNG